MTTQALHARARYEHGLRTASAAAGRGAGTTHAEPGGMVATPYRWIVLLAASTGCATTSYLYTPQSVSHWTDGYPTTRVAVPTEAPQGSVEISSFGMTELQPEGQPAIEVLHIRLAIANDGDDVPWTLTTSEQLVQIEGEGQSRPLFVNSNVQTFPNVSVARHQRSVIDFYYPLPNGMWNEGALPGFDVLWQVTTAARQFSTRTHFDRIAEAPPAAPAEVILWTGWGPYWWYDPLYPRGVFRHHRPLRAPRGPRVIITRPPRGHQRPLPPGHR